MAIKVKAMERNISFVEGQEKYAYVLQAEVYNKLSASKVIQEAALRSGISRGVMQACWDAAGAVIVAWATEGHSVAIPGLGTMRFGLRSVSVPDVNDVSANLITARRVIFTPTADIKRELAGTSVNITCYNRKGEIVKRVTSTNDNIDDDGDDNGGDNGGGGTQGGSNDGNGGGTGSSGGGTGTQGGSGSDTAGGTLYTLNISTADSTQGTVDTSVNKQYSQGSRVTIKATPQSGYAFDKWSDGSTVNPRNITLNQDITLTATFKTATVTPPSEDDDDSPFDGGM